MSRWGRAGGLRFVLTGTLPTLARAEAQALIEAAGGKGRRVGGASVSLKHANFIVAEPGARSSDVLALIRDIQRLVEDTAGTTLEPEVKLIGAFDDARR